MAGEPQPDCLFCKIVAGEIPATVVRKTDRVLAFRDIAPKAPVHVLVIPHVHYPNAAALADAEPEIAGELLAEAGRVAADEGIADYRLIFNTGAGAGQTVFHAHVHVLGGTSMTERMV
ncbi:MULTISPECIES: histidine triad nucleotide-binding protein [unclassified Streptomyces]|uniref:histidine triad nucleotide-binding protein n=1 Tax=Streptomycetaceae TaxID=2062 RepID=UPI002E75F43C|nr:MULTISPECIES: histidine triad nucleotide-binding protein [unclassified Streptomyces]MED7953322.1 histidine triad nucleotide-binding protein [Streptomyces sp. BE303]MEE1828672.1 histidine triad nucleotide-binding protein [Streptomyces sp. BE20]